MRVCRLDAATIDVERLSAKHPGIWEVQRNVERLITHGQTQGHWRIPGLKFRRGAESASVWKAKMIYPPLGGKQSGLRCIYECITIDGVALAVVLMSYLHQGGKAEQENRKLLGRRFQSYEATTEGIRDLDFSDTDSYLDTY